MRRRLRSVVLLGVVLALSGGASVQAQNSGPPDLQLLLNLDLFRPQPNQLAPPNSSDTTLDQIRTLNALGYLGNSNSKNAAFGSGASPGPEPYAPSSWKENPAQGITE
jgi:hypothetical protein